MKMQTGVVKTIRAEADYVLAEVDGTNCKLLTGHRGHSAIFTLLLTSAGAKKPINCWVDDENVIDNVTLDF